MFFDENSSSKTFVCFLYQVKDSSGDVTSVNEKSFTTLVISSCVSGIVETITLLLGVCRSYTVDGVSACETE